MTAITVTAEHIERGEPENCERCPVALAIIDALPDAGPPAVDTAHVTFGEDTPSGWLDLDLPPEVSEFIEAFDGGTADVEPFTFDLYYPEVTP